MLAATVVSGRMTSASAALRLVALSYFRGSALGRAAAEAAATAAGVPGNRSWSPRSSSSTILMQLGDLPTSELGCTTENMSCRKIVAWMLLAFLPARGQPPRRAAIAAAACYSAGACTQKKYRRVISSRKINFSAPQATAVGDFRHDELIRKALSLVSSKAELL